MPISGYITSRKSLVQDTDPDDVSQNMPSYIVVVRVCHCVDRSAWTCSSEHTMDRSLPRYDADTQHLS